MKALVEELYPYTSFAERESQLLKSLQSLNDQERVAIFLRFWVPCSIDEISRNMHLSWSQADFLLESTLRKLRADFRKAGLDSMNGQSPIF